MTKIPHYKEIILTSFECSHCGNKNNGVQSANFQDYAISYDLEVKNSSDLNRQIVTSEHASVLIPALDFEIPPNGEKGGKSSI